MTQFPVDAPRAWVIKARGNWGFRLVREREHIAMIRENPDGGKTPLTLPNHPRIKSSTLRTMCTQASIARQDFLRAYEEQ
jgi:hypothetical protein